MRFRHGERLISRCIEMPPEHRMPAGAIVRCLRVQAHPPKKAPLREVQTLLAETRAQATVEAAMLLPAF